MSKVLTPIGETAIGGFIGDVIKTIPESFISLVDSSLSLEAITAAAAGAGAGSVATPVCAAVCAAGGAAFAGSGTVSYTHLTLPTILLV